jgi:hypothetical protein
MGEYMKHLTEEEMIEQYYEEPARARQSGSNDASRHLKACAACTKRYAELQRDLDGVKPLAAPVRDANYGEQVWQSIRASLPVYEKPRWSWNKYLQPLAFAAACGLLVVTAFLAGRLSPRGQKPSITISADPQARQRVVVVVLGDHLDRSERLLVELNHATNTAEAAPLESEARELLATNRLVRQSAKQAGDPELDASLDRLERLLIELSNQPGDLSEADLNRLRQEMNTDGLLFDIRVLRSRVDSQTTEQRSAAGTARITATTGVTT